MHIIPLDRMPAFDTTWNWIVSYGIALVLHGISLYCMELQDVALYCTVSHCIVYNLTVLHCWLWHAGCISQDTYLVYFLVEIGKNKDFCFWGNQLRFWWCNTYPEYPEYHHVKADVLRIPRMCTLCHTSYLSGAPWAVPLVKKNLSCGESPLWHDKLWGGEILHMTDCQVEEIFHMRNVKKIYIVEK